MITYLYWFLVAVLVIGALFGIGVRLGKWKPALIIAAVIWLVATLAYYFWLEQIFVKRRQPVDPELQPGNQRVHLPGIFPGQHARRQGGAEEL